MSALSRSRCGHHKVCNFLVEAYPEQTLSVFIFSLGKKKLVHLTRLELATTLYHWATGALWLRKLPMIIIITRFVFFKSMKRNTNFLSFVNRAQTDFAKKKTERIRQTYTESVGRTVRTFLWILFRISSCRTNFTSSGLTLAESSWRTRNTRWSTTWWNTINHNFLKKSIIIWKIKNKNKKDKKLKIQS